LAEAEVSVISGPGVARLRAELPTVGPANGDSRFRGNDTVDV